MLQPRYYASRYFGARYFGVSVAGEVPVPPPAPAPAPSVQAGGAGWTGRRDPRRQPSAEEQRLQRLEQLRREDEEMLALLSASLTSGLLEPH